MGIALAGYAVRGPARVRNADAADDRHLRQCLFERTHFADGTQALQMTGCVEHGDSGRVIAAVFEPLQAFDQDRNDIPIGDAADYSAHDLRASFCLQSGLRRVLAWPLPLLERDL